jgi:hypothetical protein
MPCTNVPELVSACDHIEESNFPAETLGTSYVVTQPTAPDGTTKGVVVRIYGNFDGTSLTYEPSMPAGCPSTVSAGQVVECQLVLQDFKISGTQPFGVGMYMPGAGVLDPQHVPPVQEGDPAETFATAIEQYRTKYIFLAPSDYDTSYVDIACAAGTTVSIDGRPVTGTFKSIGSSGYGVIREKLGPGQSGAHVLAASGPVGIQVEGYGSYTSYQYPGGLDLAQISPPPVR